MSEYKSQRRQMERKTEEMWKKILSNLDQTNKD